MSFYNWFSKYIPNLKAQPLQQNCLCIFHEDAQASLSINLEKGLYFCHGCGAKGDIYTWVMHHEKCNFIQAKIKIVGHANVSVLSDGEVEEAHRLLMSKTYLQNMLFTLRGWLPETIEKFKLGWNDKEKRVYIPIYDQNKNLKNIRKHLIGQKATGGNPKSIGVKGHNECYFFPIDNLLKEEFILLCAGEPDTILACQCGYNAGTFTSGEGAFNRELLPLFNNKLVYICYDKDLAGLRGLKSIGSELVKYAKEVRIIDLPFGG